MMFRKACLALLAPFACCMPHAVSQTPDTNQVPAGKSLSESELRQVLATVCDQVNAFYKAEHFPIPAPSAALCSFSYGSDPNYREPLAIFNQNDQVQLKGEVLAISGRVVRFDNWAAFNAAYGAHAPLYAVKPAPKWTKDKAEEIASKFAAIFVQPWGVKLGKSDPTRHEVTFDWLFTGFDATTHTVKSKEGLWSITLRRVTASGIPFLTDGVTVQLSENYGPVGINVFFRAQYNSEDDHITPIAKDKALAEGRKGLDRLLASPSAKAWLPGGQQDGNPAMALYIVCPNDLQTDKSMLDMVYAQQGKGRLAWVVTYVVSNPSTPVDGEHVSVYIDAKDGRFLGGTL